ncbi:Ldh family oxidoreductase [Neorhizobium sp. DT-125]|uniref:Ldh family oxidoreductase n=1 Tax=Neorhizobium sp. DT-125 TaxID=3396163 RepID=UPI003F19BF9A
MSVAASLDEAVVHAPAAEVDRFCRTVFLAAGADEATADAATRAMMHGSRLGVDSHGVRLLDHYIHVMTGGRVNPRPSLAITQATAAVASLDADHGHGALAAYHAMEKAVELAETAGIGAVSIRNSSHFGPAGAYALDAAAKGYIGAAFCNSDSFVRLHDGAMRFHGTNPISFAVPIEGQKPWLLDMATSAIPYNRVKLYRSLRRELPAGVASDAEGRDTRDPSLVEMLAPVGGEFGFKGAGLAGLVEILSAVLSGMQLSFDLLPMNGPDFSTPRGLGAFVLAMKPGAFVQQDVFQAGMRRYVEVLRSSPAREGMKVMAPGDREWAVAEERETRGIPLDPATQEAFARLAERYGLEAPPTVP